MVSQVKFNRQHGYSMIFELLERICKDRRFKWEMIVLANMYLGYAALYMCRATIIISGPAMLADPALGLTKTTWGAIVGWGTAGTLMGKLFNGVLADKLGGRKVFLMSLGLCMLATGIFGTMSSMLFFSVAYFMALFAKSAGWPSMANLVSLWYPVRWRGRVWGVLSSSSRMSSLFTSLVLGCFLLIIPWQGVVGLSVVITGFVLLLLYFALKDSPAGVGLGNLASTDCDEPNKPHHLDQALLPEALIHFAKSPRIWLICVSVMCLAVLMEFQSFIPIYLKETFGLTSGIAAITSAAFPMGCLISVLLGGFIFDLLSKKSRVYVLGSMMLLAVVCISILIVLPELNISHALSLWTALLSIMFFGLAIAPCYYIPMSVFSIDFGGKHCGVLVCIIDAAGYLAAMVFDFFGGAVADQADGWQHFLSIFLCVSTIGFLSLSLFLVLEYHFQKSNRPINHDKLCNMW